MGTEHQALAGLSAFTTRTPIASYKTVLRQHLHTSRQRGDARAWGEDNPLYWAGDASQGFVEEFRVKHRSM